MDGKANLVREGPDHIALKHTAKSILRRLGAAEIVEESKGNVDVAGNCRGVWVAFEVGDSSNVKIEALHNLYSIVVHLPYCYTPDLTCPLDELERKLDNKIIATKCEG